MLAAYAASAARRRIYAGARTVIYRAPGAAYHLAGGGHGLMHRGAAENCRRFHAEHDRVHRDFFGQVENFLRRMPASRKILGAKEKSASAGITLRSDASARFGHFSARSHVEQIESRLIRERKRNGVRNGRGEDSERNRRHKNRMKLRETIRLAMYVRTDGHYRARRVAKNFLRDRPDDRLADSRAAVRAEDDQVDLLIRRR